MYTCARCGEDAIEQLYEGQPDDDVEDYESSPHDREFGWCHTCCDVRPIAE